MCVCVCVCVCVCACMFSCARACVCACRECCACRVCCASECAPMCAATGHSRAGDNPERRWPRGEGIRRRPCHQVLIDKISNIYDFLLVALVFARFKQTDHVTTPRGRDQRRLRCEISGAASRSIWSTRSSRSPSHPMCKGCLFACFGGFGVQHRRDRER